MKREKLVLSLNKETVANLNSDEMNDIKGGTQLITLGCTIIGNNCITRVCTIRTCSILCIPDVTESIPCSRHSLCVCN
jgi:natural product precursor